MTATTPETTVETLPYKNPDLPASERIADLPQRIKAYGEEKAAKRPVTLMDMGTIAAKVLKKRGYLKNIDESEEINACSIKVKALVNGHYEDWLLMFKNETHNHPTEIEPFGGAATCLGGAIRDPLSGRSYVYQAMRVTGAGDPTAPLSETLEHKLPQRKLCQTAAAGYSSYGNQIGLATGLVHEIYHPGYVAKRMEIGAVVGAAPIENVIREVPEPGDIVTFTDPEIPGRTLIKRCIATAGQTINITGDGILYIDGVAQSETYTHGKPTLPLTNSTITFPYTVPSGYIWVMGDNRTNSQDSRYFGAVPASSVTGRGVLVYWPVSEFGVLE